jgi:hypothetical protein
LAKQLIIQVVGYTNPKKAAAPVIKKLNATADTIMASSEKISGDNSKKIVVSLYVF